MTISAAQIQSELELEELELLILNAWDLCDLGLTPKNQPTKIDTSNTLVEEYYAGSIGASVSQSIKSGNFRTIMAG